MTVDNKRLEKNLHIKEKGSETRKRHKRMQCKVMTFKVVYNHLNKIQLEQLNGQFREAKWVYNSMLSQSENGKDIFSITYKDFETVTHRDKNGNDVTSELNYLPKRALQSVISGLKTNICNLAKAKEKGLEVGKLTYVGDYRSIDLAQYGISYKIVGRNRIKVNKIKKPLYVRGLDQLYKLEDRYELANAKLLRKADGFYIAVTIYCDKKKEEKGAEKPLLGIDMGCQTTLTLSDGRKLNVQVKETERLKRLQRSLARCKKHSNNRRKVCRKLKCEYGHMSNKRNDSANKILHMLSNYKVVMQDEQLANWQKNGHGDKVAHSVLGRVKDGLMSRKDTYVLSKWVPTTKLCTCCGTSVEMSLKDREFVCPVCGHKEDRDIHAAKNMLWFFGKRKTLCVERTEYNREEFLREVRVACEGWRHEIHKSLVFG